MALPPLRSMNAELAAGMSDGKYHKITKDRGGIVDPATWDSRKDLYDTWFPGLHETEVKELGDGTAHVDPYYTPTKPPLQIP